MKWVRDTDGDYINLDLVQRLFIGKAVIGEGWALKELPFVVQAFTGVRDMCYHLGIFENREDAEDYLAGLVKS